MKRRALVIAATLAVCGMAYALTEMAVHLPQRLRVQPPPADGFTRVETRSADGLTLRADFRRGSNGRALVLLHGVGDTRRGMRGFAAFYHEHGYSVLLPDSRAHGASEGSLVTYGVRESNDLRRWFDWLAASDRPRSIAALGMSLGASVALQALDDARLRAVIAECPYSSFRSVAYDRAPGLMGLPRWSAPAFAPVVEAAFLYSRLRYGIWLPAADAASAMARTRTPVFLIHGLADDRTLPHHSEALFAARREHTTLWLVPEARHVRASVVQPEEFRRRTLDFLGAAN